MRIVSLYQGGQYWLYQYSARRRAPGVRSEDQIAAFGGDPDNFQFRAGARYALLRAYDAHGKPAATPDYLRIQGRGPNLGEPVFVSGHPVPPIVC